jgi:malonate transporter
LWTLQAPGLPPLEPMLCSALALRVATSMLSIYPTLAQPHYQENIAAPALLATTPASFFKFSTIMRLLGSTGP